MRTSSLTVVMVLLTAFLAGCAQSGDDPPAPPAEVERLPSLRGFTGLPVADLPTFSAPTLIDATRAGGEPVIAVTHAGTILVASHPGFTHYFGGGDPTGATDLLSPFAGQSYMFRSTDNGTTWTPVGALPGGMGPRGPGLGVSDPEFTVMADGTICFTDLEALAAASVSCSTDDGVTWLTGNAAASGQPVDRQWLASYQDELYFTANPEPAQHAIPDFRASTDHGLTWTDRGTTPCNSDVVANPANGHLYQSCDGDSMTVSTDGGRTWSAPLGPDGAQSSGLHLNEPALDAAGNVWIAWQEDEHALHLAGTPDEGATWPWRIDLTEHFTLAALRLAAGNGTDAKPEAGTNGTYIWPWVSAGSAGRVAVSWIGNFAASGRSTAFEGPWFVFTAFVLDATGDRPTVAVVRLTPDAMHVGPICQSGTLCEATAVQGDPSGDRRLGDFFETTIEPGTGHLLAAFANTASRPTDVVGHPMFVRQVGGIRLIAEDDLASFRPTQG